MNTLIPSIRLTSVLTATGFVACGLLTSACSGGDSDAPSGPNNDNIPTLQGQLRLANGEARACEALLEATGGQIVAVDFDTASVGKAIPEGDRAGISIVSSGAGALPQVVGTVRFTGELQLLRSSCFAADGSALAGEGLTL